MKLIFCTKCQDIRLLTKRLRKCSCGKSWGKYRSDGVNAVIGGRAVPIGVLNQSFARALNHQPIEGPLGERFEAFVIPMKCPTVERVRKPSGEKGGEG